ncbi:hypothetical protein [Alcanivorax sp.]|uniref:hypothetical protein n=1 Tax=Alcanivorax sp. TaxID=1872427 RepID=UPI00198FEFD5|nr:hypothetical protein [Alcanivorax sp.]MBD3643540.1 hypothetical protein [Alcanivorax sp.]
MEILTYLAFTMLFAILSLVAFIAMTIAKAVAARPELADVDPFALRLITKISGFCFYFCTAAAVFMAILGPIYFVPLWLDS